MSTLRISNIEAKSVPASATIDEKVKITNSSGDTLVFIDGKTSGITTVGINTTDNNITFDANSNIVVTGIITATRFSGQITPTSLEIGSNIKLGNAGVITATSFVGSGANLTNLPAQATIANNADNRIITGGSGVNLNGEAELTYTSGALINSGAGYRYMTIGSTNAQGAALGLDGDSNGDGAGGDYAYIQHDSSGNFNIVANNPAGNSNLILHSGAGAETFRIFNTGHLRSQGNNVGNPIGLELRNNNTAAYSHAELSLTSQNATTSKIWCDVPNAGMRLQYNGGTTVKVNQSGNLVMANGSGIDFSATGNSTGSMGSELLKDYEEGSFTPIIRTNNNSTEPSYHHRLGLYTRIGNLVTYVVRITTSGELSTGSGATEIWGLPFAASNWTTGDWPGGADIAYYNNLRGAYGTHPRLLGPYKNSTYVRFHIFNNQNDTSYNQYNHIFTNNTILIAYGQYYTG